MSKLLISTFFLVALLPRLCCADEVDEATRAKDARRVKALLRLENAQLSEDAKASVLRYLQTKKGTEEYLSIVAKFQLKEAKEELVEQQRTIDRLRSEVARARGNPAA